ncbi:hypothetical protein [Prauserella cavernicola]|uniref:Lipocalin-like domain-containing protein n=1 Tax=Prauserella cavernicola TaxID=2800127 RepID=A0A934R084_9PSEU|nr:hypothetical protein [Prauserella cavernicola]MBK1789302.1 hypothetical protein [Prauserella cavernicola]
MPTWSRVLLPLLLVLTLAGCGERVAGTASAPASAEQSGASEAPDDSGDSAPDTSSIDLAQLPGIWRGTYTCSQGETGIELEISEPEGDSVPAVFSFFPVEGGPPTETGSFSVIGSETDGQFVFRQDAWISQPEGFVMVDLGVASVQDDTMTGRVGGPSCSDFSVTKQG